MSRIQPVQGREVTQLSIESLEGRLMLAQYAFEMNLYQDAGGAPGDLITSDSVDTIEGETPTPADLSANVRLRWDDHNLYLGVEVKDDAVLAGDQLNPRRQRPPGHHAAQPDPGVVRLTCTQQNASHLQHPSQVKAHERKNNPPQQHNADEQGGHSAVQVRRFPR